MKLVESIAKKFTKTASEEAKKEVRKTAIDFIPGALMVVGTIIGAIIFRGIDGGGHGGRYSKSTSNITNNYYFFQEVSDETLMKLLEDD